MLYQFCFESGGIAESLRVGNFGEFKVKKKFFPELLVFFIEPSGWKGQSNESISPSGFTVHAMRVFDRSSNVRLLTGKTCGFRAKIASYVLVICFVHFFAANVTGGQGFLQILYHVKCNFVVKQGAKSLSSRLSTVCDYHKVSMAPGV